jgi:hypothetical protein
MFIRGKRSRRRWIDEMKIPKGRQLFSSSSPLPRFYPFFLFFLPAKPGPRYEVYGNARSSSANLKFLVLLRFNRRAGSQ